MSHVDVQVQPASLNPSVMVTRPIAPIDHGYGLILEGRLHRNLRSRHAAMRLTQSDNVAINEESRPRCEPIPSVHGWRPQRVLARPQVRSDIA
jgi:hypothetical protein